jgi:hypothetical protein
VISIDSLYLSTVPMDIFLTSVVDPKLFVTDPDPTFQKVTDPDPTFKKGSGSGFGSDPKYLLFLQNHNFKIFK